MTSLSYEKIANMALSNSDVATGLKLAAEVCQAHSNNLPHPCPPGMLAVYLERLSEGELP